MTDHYLDASIAYPFFDNSLPPRAEIEPGDTVTFECREPLDGQVTSNSTHTIMDEWDITRAHALSGPVDIKGAEPGDALEIEILNFEHRGWGWTISGRTGLLKDDFAERHLQHWRIEDDGCYFRDSDQVKIPFEPFCGVMGVALAEKGRFDTLLPKHNGGNVDIRSLTTGATVFLPVLVKGGLFLTGDCHAAQGEGEVCVTAIEAPMQVTLRFKLRKGLMLKELQFVTPSPLTKADQEGYYVTTAHGEDLYANAQNAVRYMIEWIDKTYGIPPMQAYCLCSVAGDLKISSIPMSNRVVSFYMPLSIFQG